MKSPMGLDANLPVMDLLKEAVGILNSKRNALIQSFLPLILVMTSLNVGSQYLFGNTPMVQLITSLFAAGLSAVVATGAHRMTLCPNEDMYPDGYFGRTQLRYIGRSIQISILAAVMCMPAMMVLVSAMTSGTEGQAPAAGPVLFMVASVMAAIYVSSRLMITLPEIALGVRTDFGRAWRMSKGNGSRMALVVWILPIIMMIPALLLMAGGSLITLILGSLLSYIATLVGLVTLSLAYQFLSEFSDGGNDDGTGTKEYSATDADESSSSGNDVQRGPRIGGFDA